MLAPSLFIVAGPNGSGKSLFSQILTESDFQVFDGDKHMTTLSIQFSETPATNLWSYINNTLFAEEKEKAIASKLNYAYETNFSSDQPMASAYEFRKNGYKIHLIFMGLNSIEESIEYPQWVKPIVNQY